MTVFIPVSASARVLPPEEMRLFALDCLRWPDQTDDASQRILMINVAKTWLKTASALDRHTDNGAELFADLRSKLD